MKKTLGSIIAAIALLAFIPASHAADVASGKGTINQVDAAGGIVNITHEAIPALKWPAMTMDFKVADKKSLSRVRTGQAVSFGLSKDPRDGYVISHIDPSK
jgi:Cu/Ag efflux protein CusF